MLGQVLFPGSGGVGGESGAPVGAKRLLLEKVVFSSRRNASFQHWGELGFQKWWFRRGETLTFRNKAIVGVSWAILGHLAPNLGLSWAILRPSWGHFGISWVILGRLVANLGPA